MNLAAALMFFSFLFAQPSQPAVALAAPLEPETSLAPTPERNPALRQLLRAVASGELQVVA